jgi:hypothetical protein
MQQDRYERDLDKLIRTGNLLLNSIQAHTSPVDFKAALEAAVGEEAEATLNQLPVFTEAYEPWYSEAKALVRSLLPDRLGDFVRHYEKPKNRKDITYENYTIEDCLQGLFITRGYDKEKVVGPDAAIPHFRQQLAIVKGIETRLQSSLFEIQQLVTADVFDSELDSARELARHGFLRAAGAVAGVVLEKHLAGVCNSHSLAPRKRNPAIADFNDNLKEARVTDVPTWRLIQRLGDLRNLCVHDKETEPTKEQVAELIDGVGRVSKTLY